MSERRLDVQSHSLKQSALLLISTLNLSFSYYIFKQLFDVSADLGKSSEADFKLAIIVFNYTTIKFKIL